MYKKVSSAEAKARLAALVSAVASGSEHIIIQRRGKPLAALVSVGDLDILEQYRATSAQPKGALALVGAWRDLPDKEVKKVVSDIYASRERDTGRPVLLEA